MADKKPKRKRRTYDGMQKADALARLATSETESGPCFSDVARGTGIPVQTLYRWWRVAEGTGSDGKHREAATHARKVVAEAGAVERISKVWKNLLKLSEYLTDTEKWEDVELDKLARVLKLTVDATPAIEARLQGGGKHMDAERRLARLSKAIERTKL